MKEIVYYSDDTLIVRSMRKSDIQAISDGFSAQGWGKSVEVLEMYVL